LVLGGGVAAPWRRRGLILVHDAEV
jgi:hypothetical protein